MTHRTLTLLLLALPGLTACGHREEASAAPPEAPTAGTTERLEPYSCGTIARLHALGGLFFASQPEPADFEEVKKSGVVTVFDLRHDAETPELDERALVEGLGLAYVAVPFNGPEELTDEVFDRVREVLRTAERPMLFHCGSANRVGAVWIPYRVLDEGATLDQALEEAATMGLKTPAYRELALDYVRREQGEG